MSTATYEPRHLRSFVTLAEELHFGRAAKRLFVTQPALSGQIAKLESDIGVRLFERAHRRVELTDSGRALLELARESIRLADEGVLRAIQASSAESGVIDVAYAPAAAYDVLPWLLRDWTRDHPSITLRLREMTTGGQVPALLAREIQVGIVQARLDHPGLSRQVVRSDPAVVALHRGHPLVGRDRIAVPELAAERLMVLPRTAAPAFQALLNQAYAGRPAPQVDDIHGGVPRIMAMVAAAQGVALTHAGLTAWQPPGVAFVPLETTMTIDTAVAWRSDSKSRIVARLVEWLCQHETSAALPR